MPFPFRVLGRAVWLSMVACAPLLVVDSAPAVAQQCEFDVRPVTDQRTGYRPRDTRCEGLYIELQSAPMNLRVVSLLHGSSVLPRPGPDSRLTVQFPWSDPSVDNLKLIGLPREAGVNWALDASVDPDSTFEWDLSEVFDSTGVSLSQVGLIGRTAPEDSTLDDPVYLPVKVTSSQMASTTDSIYVVFHLPVAGEARVCLIDLPAAPCTDTLKPIDAGGYYDGFFETSLPGHVNGLTTVAVQWRQAGGSSEVGSDRFRIIGW